MSFEEAEKTKKSIYGLVDECFKYNGMVFKAIICPENLDDAQEYFKTIKPPLNFINDIEAKHFSNDGNFLIIGGTFEAGKFITCHLHITTIDGHDPNIEIRN